MKLAVLAIAALFQAGGVVPYGRSCERAMRDAPTTAAPSRESAAAFARNLAIGVIVGSGPA